jgi:uncharacterized protein (DUF608 family)
MVRRKFNGLYTGEYLNVGGFPMGGLGAGTICLEGYGQLSHFSINNKPDYHNEPYAFSAICVKGAQGNVARVLEGRVPAMKAFDFPGAGNGGGGKTYGFPRFAQASFKARFPFGILALKDTAIPLKVELTGWSPFIPNDPDNSGLPACGLEYRFVNTGEKAVDAVFSFNSCNLVAMGKEGMSVEAIGKGFVFHQAGAAEDPAHEAHLCVQSGDPETVVNCQWFRGGHYDPQTMAWKDVAEGAMPSRPPYTEGSASPGASLFVPVALAPGQKKTVRVMISWYCPNSEVSYGPDPSPAGGCNCSGTRTEGKSLTSPTYQPYYTIRFENVQSVAQYWRENYDMLRRKSLRFMRAFYDTTLPPEVIEAVAANLTILKSPTCLRERSGKFWAWEGCCDQIGCCAGSCTHVWNYAQAMCHLFPSLERTMRETEYLFSEDEKGHQTFRASLPIREADHDFHAAADGQLGGIMKAYREWRISGDTDWLLGLWPRIKSSMDYCIATWDPDRTGTLREPHHNTYDIEFWGPDGMCTSFYLGALTAMIEMGNYLSEETGDYAALLARGKQAMESDLFDGEYFIQKIEWRGLRAGDPTGAMTHTSYSTEAQALLQKEGPKYQYGRGCLADGVLGACIAACCGLPEFLNREKVASHLRAVHQYNLRKDLSAHANPQRPTYAMGTEGGLLLCTWPKGGRLSLPFIYSEEVWTGIEYQVAAHLMMLGMVEEGLEIVRTCRNRYDGRVRNPFNEYECGHWYARAMSSYALIQGLTGARYDAVERVLYLRPAISGDFRAFLCTATGYGAVGVKGGKPFVEVKEGKIAIGRMEYIPALGKTRT